MCMYECVCVCMYERECVYVRESVCVCMYERERANVCLFILYICIYVHMCICLAIILYLRNTPFAKCCRSALKKSVFVSVIHVFVLTLSLR